MDICALDQACADINKTIRYIRRIITMTPSIAEKNMRIDMRIDMIKEKEKEKKQQEFRKSIGLIR